MIVLTYIQVKKKNGWTLFLGSYLEEVSSLSDSCGKVTLAAKWLLQQGDFCSKVTPASRWLLNHGDSCSIVTHAIRWLLHQSDSWIKVTPAARWLLHQGDSCSNVTPALRRLLQQCDSCSKVTPTARWLLHQGDSCSNVTPAAWLTRWESMTWKVVSTWLMLCWSLLKGVAWQLAGIPFSALCIGFMLQNMRNTRWSVAS